MIEDLKIEDYDAVAGGKVTWDTSIWYDIGHYIGHFARGDNWDVASD